MKALQFITLTIVLFSFTQQASASCQAAVDGAVQRIHSELDQLYSRNQHSLNERQFEICALWITDRARYNQLGSAPNIEPCDGSTQEWQHIKRLFAGPLQAELNRICRSNGPCPNGCGRIPSAIRQGGLPLLRQRIIQNNASPASYPAAPQNPHAASRIAL